MAPHTLFCCVVGAVAELPLLAAEVQQQAWLEGACRALAEPPTLQHLAHIVQEGDRSGPALRPCAQMRLRPFFVVLSCQFDWSPRYLLWPRRFPRCVVSQAGRGGQCAGPAVRPVGAGG